MQPAAVSSGASIVWLVSRICPGANAEPSVTSSSPVDSTVTRARGKARTARALMLASTPEHGRRDHRSGTEHDVAATDVVTGSPHRGPRPSPSPLSRTVSPSSSSESSTITTASAPGGIGAPVMIRIV